MLAALDLLDRLVIGNDDLEVGHRLADGGGGPLGQWHHALVDRTVVGDGGFHHQGVGVEVEVVLGIRHGGLQRLGEQDGSLLWGESEETQSLPDWETLDFTGHITRFERGDADIFGDGFDVHDW